MPYYSVRAAPEVRCIISGNVEVYCHPASSMSA